MVNIWVKGWLEHSVLFLEWGNVISYSLLGLRIFSPFLQLTSSSLYYLTRESFKVHELKHRENYVTVIFVNSAVSEHFNKMWKIVTRHFSFWVFILPTSCMYGKVNAMCRIFAKSISPKRHPSKDEIIQTYKILKTRDSKRLFCKLTTWEDVVLVHFSMLLITFKGYFYCALFVLLSKL